MEAVNENERDTNQYLTFVLDEELFAVNIKNVREVLEYTNITRIPQTPEMMRGIINLRGSAVPVMDMRLKFGMGETTRTVNTCVIIIEVIVDEQTILVGTLADSVQEVIDLNEKQIEPPPSIGMRLNTSIIRGIGKKDERFIVILKLESVFTTDEIALIEELEKAEVA